MSNISKEELNAQLRAIIEKPAFSGSYADLTNKPYEVTAADRDALLRIPTAQQVSDWSEYVTGSSMIEASDSTPMKAPSFYYGLGRRTYWENHKDIIAGVPNAGGSAWSAMLTIIPYYKADDDALTQIIYSKDGTFTRVSVGTVTATATWGAWQKYSTFSGNYNDLTNKPTSSGGSATATTDQLEFNVNGATGSDTNNGSIESPFKTIQKAINSIPEIINHSVMVWVLNGTYNEDIVIYNKQGRSSITLVADAQTIDTVFIPKITVENCDCEIRLSYLSQITSVSNSTTFLTAIKNKSMYIDKLKSTATTRTGFNFMECIYTLATSCQLSNKTIVAVELQNNSAGTFTAMSGSGNAIGFKASSLSRINHINTTLTATTLTAIQGAGVITTTA